ncbi:hypothetical protein ACVWXN_000176 [Bradyrhizobium sp. i1.4.4]|uniref:hypothetical protein n=1 Tax=Bradyrhizobium TaxID=374 RepID=UPI0019112F75
MKSDVDSQHHRLAVDDELLLAVLQRCLEDPVETILGEQPNVAALALDAQPVAILFDFVDPVGARRYHLGGGR